MNNDDADVESVLGAVRRAHDPSVDDRTRNLKRLGAVFAPPSASGLSDAPLDPSSLTSSASGFLTQLGAAKLTVIASAFVAGSFGAGYVTGRKSVENALHALEQPEAPAPVRTSSSVQPPSPLSESPAHVESQVESSAVPEPTPIPSSRTSHPVQPDGESELQAGSTGLGDQVVLLRRAQNALKSGMPLLSLGIVRELEERFPNAALLEEARVVRVLSLCELDRAADARPEAELVLSRPSGALYAPALQKSCAFSPAEESDGNADSGH